MYNLVVLGAGTAGLISALAAAYLGGKVALVERHLLGGDCLNVGCVPSKSLIRPARLAAEMKRAADFGLSGTQVRGRDFPKVMERLRRLRADISHKDAAARYRAMGVDVFLGPGVFSGPDTLEVAGQTLRFRKAVIATGARALQPDIPGLDEAGFLTNETVFNLTERPKKLIVIGGGPIGCELAQAFRRLGSDVSIIHKHRLLPREDEDASAILAERFRQEGIELYLHARTLSAKGRRNGARSLVIEREGRQTEIIGDEILVGAGRLPNVEGIGLETAGVAFDPRRGIAVNDFLRTSNRRIFAAGDCCMAWKFTHAAESAARIVVQNALFRGRRRLSALTMPWCTYTAPEIAHVGMNAEDAARRNLAVEVYRVEMADNDRAVADGETEGFVKILVKKGTDRILGATIVAAHAGEMVGQISTAMLGGMGLKKLADVIHPYPTQAEAIKRVAELYNKSRLTPLVAALLRWWLKVQR
jgi:pyruvate/2-oxoglutarate dehydrogenase complex dihydrolipoamide dehydrogenase (E3) component